LVIAVISDTHLPRGERRLPDACRERIAAADLLLHAGDVVAAEVLE
jgi:predicted phosphodiesterase